MLNRPRCSMLLHEQIRPTGSFERDAFSTNHLGTVWLMATARIAAQNVGQVGRPRVPAQRMRRFRAKEAETLTHDLA
jgi:hypothetical protein